MYELPLEYLRGPYPPDGLLKIINALNRFSGFRELYSRMMVEDKLQKLPIFRADSQPQGIRMVSGVDGGSRGKELQIGYLSLVTAAGYTSELKKLGDPNPASDAELYLISSSEGAFWTGILERSLTLKLAIQIVNERAPDAILVDGGLLLKPTYLLASAIDGRCFNLGDQGLDAYGSSSYHLQLDECLRYFAELISSCYNRGIWLIGVVKRPTSDLLGAGFRDAALLAKNLEPGHGCGPFYPDQHIAQRQYSRMLEGIPNQIGVVYLRTSRSKGPIRLEFPEWMDPIQAASLVCTISDPITGIPVHVLKADRIAKVSSEIFDMVYLRLLLHAPEEQQHLIRPLLGGERIADQYGWSPD